MRTRLAATLAAGMFAGAIIQAAAFGGETPSISGPTTIHVIEHARTDTVTDTGATGDSTGDLLTFHNPVFDSNNSAKVGQDRGDCIRISPAQGTWECRWVTHLQGGSITVEGPFNDHSDTTMPITGGSGTYRDARGQMALKSRAGGTQYDFIFSVDR